MQKVFGIYDEKAGSYLPPFMMDTIGMAERAVSDTLRDGNHNFSKYAADFTLFLLGEFDELKGLYHQKGTHQILGNLLEYKSRLQEAERRAQPELPGLERVN